MKLSKDQINALVSKINQATQINIDAIDKSIRSNKKYIAEAKAVAKTLAALPKWWRAYDFDYRRTEQECMDKIVYRERSILQSEARAKFANIKQVTYNDIVILTIGAETVKDVLEAISKQLGRKIEL